MESQMVGGWWRNGECKVQELAGAQIKMEMVLEIKIRQIQMTQSSMQQMNLLVRVVVKANGVPV